MNYIQEMTSRLHDVNRLLSRIKSPEDITFGDAELLVLFYQDYSRTNRIIREAELIARRDLDELQESVEALLEETGAFKSEDLSVLESCDYKAIADGHIKSSGQDYREAYARTRELGDMRKYNALDYHDEEEDPYYRELAARREEQLRQHAAARGVSDGKYEEYRRERVRSGGVFCFHTEYLDGMVTVIRQIADSITEDIRDIRKEVAL